MERFGAALGGSKGLLAPGGSGTAAEPAHLPEGEKVEQRTEESDEHHGKADGVGVEAFGEMPGRGGQDKRADANEETDSVKGDEGAADALKESEEEAGPVEPMVAGGGGE